MVSRRAQSEAPPGRELRAEARSYRLGQVAPVQVATFVVAAPRSRWLSQLPVLDHDEGSHSPARSRDRVQASRGTDAIAHVHSKVVREASAVADKTPFQGCGRRRQGSNSTGVSSEACTVTRSTRRTLAFIVSMRLVSLPLSAAAEEVAMPKDPEGKLLFILIDGTKERVFRDLLERGELPFLVGLLEPDDEGRLRLPQGWFRGGLSCRWVVYENNHFRHLWGSGTGTWISSRGSSGGKGFRPRRRSGLRSSGSRGCASSSSCCVLESASALSDGAALLTISAAPSASSSSCSSLSFSPTSSFASVSMLP